MNEPELRAALRAHAAGVDARGDWMAVENEARRVRGRQRARATAMIGTALAAAVVATVVVLVDAGRREDDPTEVGVAGTSTTASPPTSTASTTTPDRQDDPEAVGGIWPFATADDLEAYESSGATKYDDASDTARAFATEYVGMSAPVFSEERVRPNGNVEVDVRPNPRATLTSTVVLDRLGDDEPWTVVDARAPSIVVDAPRAGDEIASPLRVEGTASAFEGTVSIEVRQDGMTAGRNLGTGFGTGNGGPERGPFDASVQFRAGDRSGGAVLCYEGSGEDGRPVAFTVVKVRFAR